MSATNLQKFSTAPSRPICRPSDRQPSSFVVNLKAAMALDLSIPPSILARADEVIE
jgi:hypothetical protein